MTKKFLITNKEVSLTKTVKIKKKNLYENNTRLETSNILPICEEKDLQQCKQRNGSSPVCRSKWCFKPIGTLKAVSHSGQTLFLGLPMEKKIYDQFMLLLFVTPFFSI